MLAAKKFSISLSIFVVTWTVLCDGSLAQIEKAERAAITTAAQNHFRAVLAQDWVELDKDYADKVLLLPGNELLKSKTGEREESKAVTVNKSELLTLMREKFAGRDLIKASRIDEFVNLFDYQILDTKLGDNAIEPADPVKTADGKLHFTMEAGDVLVKAIPKKGGDFLLMQFRDFDDRWKIVAEYLD